MITRKATRYLALVVVAGLSATLPSAAFATTYHVAAGSCSHGSGAGLDSNDGTSRTTAFLSVQKCLDEMGPGDTCQIHTGTYTGSFNCCGNGNSSIESVVASKSNPTRIVGADGDQVTLRGATGQTPAATDHYYETNLGTLTFKADGGTTFSKYFEIGNMTINPGNSSSIVATRAHWFYIHDVVIDDLSNYNQGNHEGAGLIWAYSPEHFYIENLTISNGGTIHEFNPFYFNRGYDGKVRSLEVHDMDGAVEAAHYNENITYEFVKVRNWRPWDDDDGGLRDMYNSQFAVNRYWSVAETSGGVNPISGWFNSRSTGTRKTQMYAVNVYFEDIGGGSNYGAWHHQATGTGGKEINDWRVYNSVAVRLPYGIMVKFDTGSSGDDCLRHDNDFNAYVDVPQTVYDGGTSTECKTYWTKGPNSIEPSDPQVSSEHIPAAGSPLRDAGHSGTYGGTPYFPAPQGGGSRVDIGAFEYGAGSWPYEFQSVATVGKLTPRICWDTGVSGCDVIIPLWDPWAFMASSRSSAPDWYWVEIDTSNGFRSGNGSAAKGLGAMHESGAVNSSNRYYDVPAGVLQDGQSYYVQVRVGEQEGQTDAAEGPGPWSLGFYRFDVDTTGGGGQENPPSTVENARRGDKHSG